MARMSRWLLSGFEQVHMGNCDIQIAAIRVCRQLAIKSQRPSQIACQIPDVGIDVKSGCTEPARRGQEMGAHTCLTIAQLE
ncbi:MAG: hypothetical protein FD135_1271 [Comamonadaceae bacterium]|nr:MAG: hypothetical protein FD135_1271 [Comamonadaceae bacterium]